MRLFEENGYANTTVEQIADAAEVSPSTFFRYFPSKEVVLIANDLDHVTVAALAEQPPHLPTLTAFRRAFETTLSRLSEDEWRFERARIRMVLSVPELMAAQLDEYRRTVGLLAEAECKRLGRDPGDLEVRVFFGALAGGLTAILDDPNNVAERMHRALEFMEAGMPLGATANRHTDS